MIQGIQKFFKQQLETIKDTHSLDPNRELQFAAASLLIEVSRADSEILPVEQQAIIDGVQSLFGLTRPETEELVRLAEEEFDGATCLYEFTRLINEGFDYQQKLTMLSMMWNVAFSDLDKDRYEEHVIRKVCDLLYISHKDFVRLRHVADTH